MIQLEATATGELFDLYPDTSVELEFNNPAFASADEGGSFGYPFDLPGTQHNHRITGHAYMLERRDVLGLSIPVRLTLFGLPIAEGVAKLTYPVSRERIRIYLVVSSFADVIKNKTLKGVDYGPAETIADWPGLEARMLECIEPRSAKFAFPVSRISRNPAFYQNDFHEGAYYAFSEYYRFGQPGYFYLSQFFFSAVAQPYVEEVMRAVFNSQGYGVDATAFFSTDDLRNLILHHHRTVQITEAVEFVIDMQEAVPDISLSAFLRAMQNQFNLRYFFDERRKQAKVVPLQSLLDAPALEWTDKASPGHEVTPLNYDGFNLSYNWISSDSFHGNYYNEQFRALLRYPYANTYYRWTNDRSFTKQEELNELTAPAPLDTYWVEDANAFFYYEGGAWYRLAWQYQASAADVQALPSPVEAGVYFDTTEQVYYIYLRRSSATPEWLHFAYPKTEDLKVGNGNTKLTSDAHTVELRLKNYYDLPFPVPCDHFTEGPESIFLFGREGDTSLRLLIYRGLDATIYPGYRYPFATPDVYDTRGVKVGTHSLRWDGEHGLYEKFWKRWLDFLGSTRKVTRPLRLSAADIYNLDMTQQVRIENVNYLIGRINVAVTMRGISEAKAELYTVGSGTESIMASTVGTPPNVGIGVMAVGSTNIVG